MNKRKFGVVALALAMILSIFSMGNSGVAGAQSMGPVLPCNGTDGGWVSVYYGSVNCTYRNHYNAQGALAYRQTVMDLHGPYSNGSACDWNVNCLRGAIECFDWNMGTTAWSATGSGNAFEWGAGGAKVGLFHNHSWERSSAQGAFPTVWSNPAGPREWYDNGIVSTGPVTGVSSYVIGMDKADLMGSTALESVPPYTLRYKDYPSSQACYFRNKGVIPAGRMFQAAANFYSTVHVADHTESNKMYAYLWTHCLFC